jgi:hypothetical protein
MTGRIYASPAAMRTALAPSFWQAPAATIGFADVRTCRK